MFKYFLIGCFLTNSTFGFAEQQTWYFVRHFEKQQGDNPSLTESGKARAAALARFFSDKSLNHLYSTDYHRTLETATPVSILKNVSVEFYNPRKLAEFSSKVKTLDHVLVVGHSNTTPELLGLMGGKVIHMEESDYGVLYMLRKQGSEFTTQSILIPQQ
ncbi:histidine phosphatase family protein [Paraglaciecola arctica]|uniref:Phosphoglycerate mutase n=1 Tax=Paraglaciecola arctica BSs20135 TaxID=493475 RepID=K6YIJ9_9ALTE|nr:histidine phosphatase family protein [Paraglaciecola arctica]GAC17992.1 phosphoglycerate mutase [Paraglaciecola arctica BSs20135]